MPYSSTRTPSLSHGASDPDAIPPLLEASDSTDDEGGSESDSTSFVSALVQPSAIASSRAARGPLYHQPDASSSRNAAVTSRVADGEMPALMSCSSSEYSDEYTDSEGDVRNDTNPRPNEEAIADRWGDEAGDLDNHAGDFGEYNDIETLRNLFPLEWTANVTTDNTPLPPPWNTFTPEDFDAFEDMNNMVELLLGPNPNFFQPQNADRNQLGEDRAKKILDALEVVDEHLLERFFALKAGSGEDGRGCAVCYEDLRVLVSKVVALPCTHVFHEHCLLPWFQNHSTCPSCRFDLDPQRLVHRGYHLFLPNTSPPPTVDPVPNQLIRARQQAVDVLEATMNAFDSDSGTQERQERQVRERIRTDLESHISTAFDVTTSAGYEQASAYVRHEMNRTRHEVTTLELRMSEVQARLRLTDELAAQQPPSEIREAIAQELRSMALAVRELTSQLEELRSRGARLQIQRQQQELQEFMTAGRDPRPRQFPFPILQHDRPSPPLPTDPPNPPLSSPVFSPALLPPIDLPEGVESEPRPTRVSDVFHSIYEDRGRLHPLPLEQNHTGNTSPSLSVEYTPINDENDPGSVTSSSRQGSSSNRNSRRRPSDRVPLSQLDDAVEENDDRYLNEMLPPSQRPSTSTNVIAPQGSPAEVEAMLMATLSDEDDEPHFDSRNARRRQFRTQSPAMVMRTRITGEQQALLLNEPYSREERYSGLPLTPGGRPATPVGPPIARRPPLELRGAGTPVLDVEMRDTSPVRVYPLMVPPSAIVRDPRAHLPIQARRRAWYPREEPEGLPPLVDIPGLPASPFSPHSALNGYMTGGNHQATWDAFALRETETTTSPTAVGNPTQSPGTPVQLKEYVRPAGKSIREWIEDREKALAAESCGGTRPARSVTVKGVSDEEA